MTSPLRLIGLTALIAAMNSVAALSTRAEAADPPTPQWIWSNADAGDSETVHFRKVIDVTWPKGEGRPKAAELVATCDNAMEVKVNGKPVARSGSWEEPVAAVVRHAMHHGRNVITVAAKNEGGPAGLILQLDLVLPDGTQRRVVTDASWRWTRAKPDAAWDQPEEEIDGLDAAHVIAPLGDGAWAQRITAASFGAAEPEDANKPASIPAERITTLEGFKAELVYSVPREQQGSWVALTIDPKGRLYASDQYGKLYRITPAPIGGAWTATKVEVVDLPIGGAQGMCWAFDSLYVVVSHGSSGLFRLRDTDGDDTLDEVKKLRGYKGGGEHGPHAVIPAPDGESLYVVGGNHTNLPSPEQSRVPRVWSEDLLLPRQWDARGHARGKLAPGGWICKTDPEGKTFELISVGYRNQYDIAFNRAGDLFTYDADMEWDIGTPWYRPTRICHVTSGSEFGWRSGTGKWPVYFPDSLPPVVDIGPGSPTGVVFGYGAKYPAKYQNALLALDWSFGKIFAVHLTPDGATYRAEVETFASAAPLPGTDLIVNPHDGALYFAIGGRRVQSGLYRIVYTGDESTAPAKPDADFAADHPATIRRKLEQYHGKAADGAIDAAWPHLGHEDRFVRFAARTAIEHQPVEQWRERALTERNPQARIDALLALARHGEKSVQGDLLDAVDAIDPDALNEAQKLAALRVLALAFIRMGEPDEQTRLDVIEQLDPMFPSDSKLLDRELARVLVYLEAPGVVGKCLDRLADAGAQEEKIHYAFVLRNVKTGWTMAQRRTYFEWFHTARGWKGGASFAGFINNIRDDAIAKLSEAEKTALADVLKAKPEQPADEQPPREFVKAWTVDELTAIAERELPKGGRDFERGRKMFAAALCDKCHAVAGEGAAAGGPDLTAVAGRFTTRDLLEAIVDPNKEVSDQYRATIFILNGGRQVVGRVANLGGDRMSIVTNMLEPGAFTSINASEIVTQIESPVSMMMPGLLNTLSEPEVLDLLAYLQSGGERDHKVFK